MIRETLRSTVHGGVMGIILAILGATELGFVSTLPKHVIASGGRPTAWLALVLIPLAMVIIAKGFFTVRTNQARVFQLFGRYVGTTKDEGLRWANPLFTTQPLTLAAFSFETNVLKVNDLSGNPVEIGAIIVWRIVDTAQAIYSVQDVKNFVQVQCEAALRTLAMRYPYDSHEPGTHSLRGDTATIVEELTAEVRSRVALAGIEIVEANLGHLKYAPEIAQAMLQRQQASAIIAARQTLVEGAVSIVEMALERLSSRKVVALDEERKAAMVSNLLVVLCGERNAQPVINTGTLYAG